MSEEPLAIGAGFVVGGFSLHTVGPSVYATTGIHVRGWAWLFLLVGLVIIGARLSAMVR